MAKIVPFTEARANLTELLDEMQELNDHFLITRNGRPAAVLMSAGEYEALSETLDVLADSHLMEVLRASEADAKAGRIASLKELRRRGA